jgi:protease I
MAKKLKGKKVALLATDGFEQSELTEPKKALERAGAEVQVISPQAGKIRAWRSDKWGKSVTVDRTVAVVSVGEYDALVLPGGVMNPDRLRMDEQAVEFVRSFVESGKPVASICHGPWMLVEADVVGSRRMTSYPSIRTDLNNAGAVWVNEETVIDGNILTSRSPADLPAFCARLVEQVAGVEKAEAHPAPAPH